MNQDDCNIMSAVSDLNNSLQQESREKDFDSEVDLRTKVYEFSRQLSERDETIAKLMDELDMKDKRIDELTQLCHSKNARMEKHFRQFEIEFERLKTKMDYQVGY